MKYLLTTILAGALLLSGCTTLTNSDGTTTKVPNVELMQATAQSAAYLGSMIYLNGLGDGKSVKPHPEARTAFVNARNALAALIAAGQFNSADLVAALQQLPIKELQGDTGTIIVGEAVVLWDAYGRQLASLDKSLVFQGYVLPVAQSILRGLDMALR